MYIIQSSTQMKTNPTESSSLETECLFGEKVEIINIESKSKPTTLFKLMELVLLGDLFSISLADELNMIPEDIEGIENLKKLLED